MCVFTYLLCNLVMQRADFMGIDAVFLSFLVLDPIYVFNCMADFVQFEKKM